MQVQVKNKQNEFKNLQLTEQLIFLIDSKTHLNESVLFKVKKSNAIIGALLADLFLMKRGGLIDNKVLVTTNDKSHVHYINEFENKIRNLEAPKRMEDIIHAFIPLADDIEQEIRKRMLEDEWFVEKKGLIPFISQKEIQPDDETIIKLLQARINASLRSDQKPTKKLVYLMAILDGISFLDKVMGQKVLENEKKESLELLMQEHYLAKMLHEAIKNQPEPQTLKMIDLGPPSYIAGINGLGSMNR